MIKLKMICPLCEREVNFLEYHHLIPKQLHTKKKYRNKYSKQYMGELGIRICRDCHLQIHKLFTHSYLAESLNTLKSIKSHPKTKKYIKWVIKQK